jgi:acyl-CoA thioester hydrolase
MPPEATIRRRVQWFDTDASTKEHNTAPLRWMEEAEAELLDSLGIVHEVYGSLPRAHVEMDYRRPLRFWDQIEVRVAVAELGRTSITYDFTVRKGDEVAVDGRVVAVFIDRQGHARPWPDEYRRRLTGESPFPPP